MQLHVAPENVGTGKQGRTFRQWAMVVAWLAWALSSPRHQACSWQGS